MSDCIWARPADQALAVPVEPVARLDPAGFDPSREAAAMEELDRRYLVATPRQIPVEAHWIAARAGDPDGSRRYSGFARRNAWMLQRMPSEYGQSWAYRLSRDGALIADAIAMEARQGGDGETRLHAKHDSAGRKASPERTNHAE